MHTFTWRKAVGYCAAVVLLAGCHTMATERSMMGVSPVVPASDEVIIRDQLIILVDVSGSLTPSFDREMELVDAFTAAMPDGTYLAGIDSFGGTSMARWFQQPLVPFSRGVMTGGAASIERLGSLTPLDQAVYYQRDEYTGRGGRGALLLFSDGLVDDPNAVLRACQEMQAAHGGELCIYTVHVGPSNDGMGLLQEMANVTGCGAYYDGATLTSAEAIQGMVRDIFIGPGPPPAPAPVPVPVDLEFRNVYFEVDKAVIAPQYNTLLDDAAQFLKDNPEAQIRLDGHTDATASDSYNQQLSQRRVAAVQQALVQRGAEAGRLLTQAHGEAMPAAPNNSAENRQQNRRVELTVVR